MIAGGIPRGATPAVAEQTANLGRSLVDGYAAFAGSVGHWAAGLVDRSASYCGPMAAERNPAEQALG